MTSRSGRGRRVRLEDMDAISSEQVRRSDVLVGKLTDEEKRVGASIIEAVLSAKGRYPAEAVALLFEVDPSLVREVWNDAD